MEPDRTRKFILIASTLASFLTPFIGAALNLALPDIAKAFNLSSITLGWTVTSYLLTTAVFLLPMGKLADLIGRKRIFIIGLVTFLLGSLLSGLSFSGLSLIAFRLVQGLGGAMIFATSVALLTSAFPPEKRGYVLGLNTAAVYTGLSLGPVAGGFLVQQLGWRSIFWVTMVIGLLALVLVSRAFEDDAQPRPQAREKFDWLGTALYASGLVSFMLGFSRLPAPYAICLSVTGAILLVVFFFLESQRPTPVFNTSLFRHNRAFAFSNLAALINYSSTSAVAYLLSLYLQYIHHLTPRTAGLVLIAQPVCQALVSPVSGKASDRIDPRLLASGGMELTVVGLLALVFIWPETELTWIVLALIFLGVGFGLFSSPNTNSVISSVGPGDYGIASATLATMRMVGQMLSLGVTMMMMSIIMGNVKITPKNFPLFMRSLRLTFIVFAFLNFLGIFASLARGKKQDTASAC
ncbi:MAG: MFS transporter [Candidatus Saccharicenans sp.]